MKLVTGGDALDVRGIRPPVGQIISTVDQKRPVARA
jgi:hypothetical protein